MPCNTCPCWAVVTGFTGHQPVVFERLAVRPADVAGMQPGRYYIAPSGKRRHETTMLIFYEGRSPWGGPIQVLGNVQETALLLTGSPSPTPTTKDPK